MKIYVTIIPFFSFLFMPDVELIEIKRENLSRFFPSKSLADIKRCLLLQPLYESMALVHRITERSVKGFAGSRDGLIPGGCSLAKGGLVFEKKLQKTSKYFWQVKNNDYLCTRF